MAVGAALGPAFGAQLRPGHPVFAAEGAFGRGIKEKSAAIGTFNFGYGVCHDELYWSGRIDVVFIVPCIVLITPAGRTRVTWFEPISGCGITGGVEARDDLFDGGFLDGHVTDGCEVSRNLEHAGGGEFRPVEGQLHACTVL